MCWIGRKDNKQVAKRDFYVYKIGLVNTICRLSECDEEFKIKFN